MRKPVNRMVTGFLDVDTVEKRFLRLNRICLN